jgi:glycine/D-amino acid oxidase-like deaminating enzyme
MFKTNRKPNAVVIGAGLTGLCVANHLIDLGYSIVVYTDQNPLKTTSSLISGLCYPFSGPAARPHKYAIEALEETMLYARRFLNPSEIRFVDIHRHAKDDEQACSFKTVAAQYDGLSITTNTDGSTTLIISNAMYINMPAYISAMVRRLEANGAIFKNKRIHSVRECDGFDLCVICGGAYSNSIQELSSLNTSTIPGHCIGLPSNSVNTDKTIITKHILIPSTFNNDTYIGGTYEKDCSKHTDYYLQTMLKQFPQYLVDNDEFSETTIRKGIRGYLPGKLPGIMSFSKNGFALLGMGSKGLMYHVWMTKHLIRYIQTGSKDHIPNDYLIRSKWLENNSG